MTDIDELVAGLRTDVPEMSDRAFAAGRARLQDPPLVAASEPAAVVVPLPPRRRVLRSPPRLRLIASAAAVVVLAASVLINPFGDSPPTAVAESLTVAARKVASTPDQPVGPGQYRYVQVLVRQLSETEPVDGKADSILTYTRESARETWVPTNLSNDEWLERRTEATEFEWVDGSDERAKELGVRVREPYSEELRARCGNFWGSGCMQPTPEYLAGLPTEPRALYEALKSEQSDSNPEQMLNGIGSLLSSGVVPADIRANIYEALAFVPGLTITDQRANLKGRIGVAYGVIAGQWQTDLLIDPATGEYIGSRWVLAEDMSGHDASVTTVHVKIDGVTKEMTLTSAASKYFRKGAVFEYSAVSTAVVNQLGEKPAN